MSESTMYRCIHLLPFIRSNDSFASTEQAQIAHLVNLWEIEEIIIIFSTQEIIIIVAYSTNFFSCHFCLFVYREVFVMYKV